MRTLPPSARAFITVVVATGLVVFAYGGQHFQPQNGVRFAFYVAATVLTSGLKVRIPGILGTMAVNDLFIIIGILELSFGEALVLAASAAIVQTLWQSRFKPGAVHVIFNSANMSVAVAAAYSIYNYIHWPLLQSHKPLLLVAASSVFFLFNTLPIAAIISLTEHKSFRQIWYECYFWSFPYYLVGAGIAGFVSWMNNIFGWEAALLFMPAVYVIYRSYRLYLGKLEDEKRHVEEMAELHLRTIEALALAIEAKDHSTHDHLQRVRVYALELAKLLAIANDDLEALRAAALLHDIGKLAVPEHIISKPGRLTPEEFEKMKIHPVVGAEILERVQFPYPVVPIVRAHHERWDGSGYPYGVKGTDIPIGARILSVVDCLDALASDRQYRRALPLDMAMEEIRKESGKSFDPEIVEILFQHYKELEQIANQQPRNVPLSTELKVANDAQPATGLEKETIVPPTPVIHDSNFLTVIGAARQEAQALFELSQELGTSLSLDETLSVVTLRLKRLVPYDSVAIYILKEGHLAPEHVSGDNFRLFSSLQIPVGQGVSGWVAHNRKPVINGNPSVEPGYLNDPSKFSTLRSALAVPLEGVQGVVGVMTLYHAQKDAFTRDHLRILLAISSKVAFSIENALKYRQAETSAVTDYVTGLPNARSLFLHLDRELARSQRVKSTLAVMVCDLDGFKQVNDRFGHLAGNRALRLFGKRLTENCRQYDYVARMGGDEFVIVAPDLKQDAAEPKAEVIRQLATEVVREICGEELASASVGIACYPLDGVDAEELLAEADRRMYKEKQLHHERAYGLLKYDSVSGGNDVRIN